MALISLGLFKMPIEVSYCLGYAVATIAGSILVPGMLSLNERGYGKAKGIPGAIIAAGTFENIVSIIIFGICK